MPIELGDPKTLLIAGASFGLVLALWCFVVVAYVSRRERRRADLKARLDPEGNQSLVARELRLWHEGGEATLTVYDEDESAGSLERLTQQIQAASFGPPPKVVLSIVAGLSVLTCLIGYVVTARVAPALVGAFAVCAVFWWLVGVRSSKRPGLFERQLVDALELSARALRAGNPLLGSFRLISEEIPAPVGPLFGEVCQEHELGVDLETALRHLTAKERSADLRLFAASLSINLRTGGNLADVIEGLAKVIRERVRLQRKFRVLTAQTQISKRILTGLPIVMFFALNVLNPEYMAPMYDTTRGNIALLVALTMLAGGWWVMGRMASFVR